MMVNDGKYCSGCLMVVNDNGGLWCLVEWFVTDGSMMVADYG